MKFLKKTSILAIICTIMTSTLFITSNIGSSLALEEISLTNNEIVVPDDYSTIQEAINNANEYDTIRVKEGIYRENIRITKPITLVGLDKEKTTIDALNNDDGIHIKSSSVSVSGFKIINVPDDCCSAGIQVKGKDKPPADITISNCIITEGNIGIRLDYVKDAKIKNCDIYDNPSCSIYLTQGSEDITIDNCRLHDNGVDDVSGSISVFGDDEFGNCKNIEILNCYVYNNKWEGIYICFVNNINIHNNHIYQNDRTGITGTGKGIRDVYIHDNIIYSNGFGGIFQAGIYLQRISDGVTINNNDIYSNNPHGIYINNGSGVCIFENDIHQNIDCGVLIQNSGIHISKNNLIYHNNFIDNNCHAYDQGVNKWDNGYKTNGGGNYWSGFKSQDENEDGIYDNPYRIQGGLNRDNYPLTEKDGRQEKVSVKPFLNIIFSRFLSRVELLFQRIKS